MKFDSIKIRPATSEDIPFLSDMLFEAGAISEKVREMGKEQALTLPAMIYFLENFGRIGDFGFIAETEDAAPIGAAWARLFSEENKSYGFISDKIPEFAIAVESEFRGLGIGTKLLEQLIEEAHKLKRRTPALKLYERLGFRDAGISKETESSLIMIMQLN